jgi:hypothetical protein
MASDFEKQQRWQLALFGLRLFMWPIIGLVVIAVLVAWGLSGAPLPHGGGW